VFYAKRQAVQIEFRYTGDRVQAEFPVRVYIIWTAMSQPLDFLSFFFVARLFLHTISDATDVPAHVVAYSTVVTYSLIRNDIEEELLDRFMRLAKPRIDSERYLLLQV
jgi:hypothetical protein